MPQPEPEALLVLPHLRVQNANIISSPLTWGFPAPSAFLGFVHALERKLSAELNLRFDQGLAIICHQFEAQVSQPAGKRTNVFHLSRNPIGKDGKASAFVEEGRGHLEVSLVIGLAGDGLYGGASLEEVSKRIANVSASQRLAGGSLLPALNNAGKQTQARIVTWPGTAEEERKLSKRLAYSLLPGFALVSRETMLEEHQAQLLASNPNVSIIDALLDLSSCSYEPIATSAESAAAGADETSAAEPESADWQLRANKGWLVPIPAGFQALTELYEPGVVKNTRDRTRPFRFVEGLYTLGQWLSPHRVNDIRHLLWQYQAEPESGIYRCTTPHYGRLRSTIEGKSNHG